MSLNPYHYTTQPRHGFGAPGAGDFDQPGYLNNAPGDYGLAPLAIPLWAWLAAGVGGAGGAYWYGKGTGSANAAALAAAAQAGGAPPAAPAPAPAPAPASPGYMYPSGTTYYPPGASAPGAAPPPTALTDQPWFWPALIATAGILAFVAFRPRS
jgi:hypothetical protein